MNNELLQFEMCKELAKYLPMETWFYWEMTKGQTDLTVQKLVQESHCQFHDKDLEFYPAPLLSELLRVSPIYLTIHNDIENDNPKYFITVEHLTEDLEVAFDKNIELNTADNLTEQVAQIILQYYRSIE